MRIPDLGSARRLLCVQPHYDDNDIGAGGTIAALRDAGAEVAYLTVTDDLVGVLDASLSDQEATAQLRAEQARAGAEIGVGEHYWLGLPDAGEHDYFALRRGIIEHIRRVRPDFVFSVDPWLPYEAHSDHLLVGRATAEAAMLQHFPRIRTDPAVDRAYRRYFVTGVVFYFTTRPNLHFDIGATRERKHRALDAYTAQFTPEGLERLHRGVDAKEREWAEGRGCTHAEALRVMPPGAFHVNLDAD